MLSFLITSGEAITPGWTAFWFTHGLTPATLVEEDLTPMFLPQERVERVAGDKRKTDGTTVPASDAVWKFPKDVYDVTVDWEGPQVLPVGATSLVSVDPLATDPDLGSPNDVTGTIVAGSGIAVYLSYVTTQAGTKNNVYTIRQRVGFNNARALDKYVSLTIRNPRKYAATIFKYPADVFEVAVKWTGRMPRGATALGAITVKAYDASDVDVSSSYVIWGQAIGAFSVGKIYGGTGGETILLEFAQTFDNGRVFHEYALLTVRVPPT